MSAKTKIQWCDSTINFWRGCDKVSDGCKNCYITTTIPFRMSGQKHGDPRVRSPGAIKEAFKLNRKPWICNECGEAFAEEDGLPVIKDCYHTKGVHRRRIFSLSLGDWLDDQVPVEWLANMLDTIRQCDQVIWILVTKRPENFSKCILATLAQAENISSDEWPCVEPTSTLGLWLNDWECGEKIPQHIVVLTSVENQATADLRVPKLFEIPARWHGLSMEPLLGPVVLGDHFRDRGLSRIWPSLLKWIIVGGESGSLARTCQVNWIRSIIKECKTRQVPVFVKQIGSNMRDVDQDEFARATGKSITDKKGGDWSEWPEDLRIRQFLNV